MSKGIEIDRMTLMVSVDYHQRAEFERDLAAIEPDALLVSEDTPTSRSTYTFLFTDMEGSTIAWETAPEMPEVVERHFEVLRRAVSGAGGTVFASMGDGIAAAFGSAGAAARAAIEAQRHFASGGPRVRMGLHTGEVQRVGDDFRGRALNRAARIMAVGHGGQILVSGLTAYLLLTGPEPIELVDLGPHRLRDLTEPERIWQVVHHDLDLNLPPLRSLDTFPNNLPIQRSELVGRDDDVARTAALIERHPIVTLIGPGGVGKTRLALQAAAEQPAVATSWFVSLAEVDDPNEVIGAIATTARVDRSNKPLDALVGVFGSHRVVLVLDNCEHVIEAAAEAAEQLTEACRNLHIIATSREPLGIEGEYVVPIRPLKPDAAALELFESRANASGARLEPSQRALARHICERLDGLPLAIELAAARVASLGLPAIVDALDDRFWLLSGGRRRAVDRHQTMRATVEWSHQLLEPELQRLFEWMAVFPGGFELDAARHVAELHGLEPNGVPDLVGSLVRKSMVEADIGAPVVRYHLLETVRAFALETLGERGETQAAAMAQAEWVATLTGLPADEPCSADVQQNAIRLERETVNWRQAVLTATRTGSSQLAGRLCGPPTRIFLFGRHELREVLIPLLDLCGQGAARHAVLCAMAVVSVGTADAEEVARWSDELAALEDDTSTGTRRLVEWLALKWTGDVDAAVDLCLRSADDRRFTQDTRDLFVGIATTDRFSLTESTEDAESLADRALEIARRTETSVQRTSNLLGAAWALVSRDPDRSLALAQEALEELPNLPTYLRLTLSGNASRLLTRIDPSLAATHLLDRLDTERTPSSYVDLIPAVYATVLLHRLGNPIAGRALATLAASPIAPHLSLMRLCHPALHAAEQFDPVALDALIDMLRTGLVPEAARRDSSPTTQEEKP